MSTLTFTTLRRANVERLEHFKNALGNPAQWLQAFGYE